MRAVIQRVKQAAVKVDDQITGQINLGLLIYLGVAKGDHQGDVDYIAKKITHLRIFPDENNKMNLSLHDVQGQILLISQFTLCGDCRKGRRPSFDQSGDPDLAKSLYEETITELRDQAIEVQTGIFAAHMEVTSTNDGPVTFLLDSKKLF